MTDHADTRPQCPYCGRRASLPFAPYACDLCAGTADVEVGEYAPPDTGIYIGFPDGRLVGPWGRLADAESFARHNGGRVVERVRGLA